jgi:GNAT superfamily N-acetyltransferase
MPMEVVRTYLEIVTREALRPASPLPSDARVVRLDPRSSDDYRRMYRDVGGPWHWRDRLAWDDDTLRAHLESPEIAVWTLLVADESAGYFELRRNDAESVEIAYFGLVPSFIGRRLGGALLTRAVEEAWRFGARRVWLHTCTLDSPHALPNYRARGFRDFRTERYEANVEVTGKSA